MINYLSLGIAVPKLFLADPKNNEKEIIKTIGEATSSGSNILILPELAVTGTTCGDLFFQPTLILGAMEALENIIKATNKTNILIFVGAPLPWQGNLYNCMVAILKGKVVGIIPKKPCENRWFASNTTTKEIDIFSQRAFFGDIYFNLDGGKIFIEESFRDIKPMEGSIIINPWAEKTHISTEETYSQLALATSKAYGCTYVKCGPGMLESSTDGVYSGYTSIIGGGRILAQGDKYKLETTFISARVNAYGKSLIGNDTNFREIPLSLNLEGHIKHVKIDVNPRPFVPTCPTLLNNALDIQAMGLARRLIHTGAKTAVCGVSGGVDSTLALLAILRAFQFLNKPNTDIIAITMPGFGTTGKTFENAKKLIHGVGATYREINIGDAVNHHFKDIGQNKNHHDITYENAQARERTQILMDVANMENGIVVGTGGFSEIALGFATYNGDHMSMYNVNASLPKTLIIALLNHIAATDDVLGPILTNIVETPISPELLPPNRGEIAQKTEAIVGPYQLTDFFLYHMLKYQSSPYKIMALAREAFETIPKDEIKTRLREFYKRFFASQYKRSCSPDGPQIIDISLSPRGGWVMPSDAMPAPWLEELENMREYEEKS